MTTYRERLTAPVSWWIAALAFAAVWGWVFLVATNWPIAIVVTVLLAAAGGYAVWRYGSVVVTAGPDGLRVGRAHIDSQHVGPVRSLDRASYRTQLGTGADARAYLITRPYLDHGVLVTIDDPSDPAPYWLVSSRHPDALAVALAPSAPTASAPDPNGDAPHGQAT
ncbi:MAG: DUF3093 domain-containing protein [Aeromicrobium sp.]